jgi:hypothetical protein
MKATASLDHSTQHSGAGGRHGSDEKIMVGWTDFTRDPKAKPTKKRSLFFR